MNYDLIIIGAGIAGLYTALQYLEKYPGSNVAILEKYKYLGGRVVTYNTHIDARGPVHWENGAGRIHKSHKLVLGLVKKYKLSVSPIQGEQYSEPVHAGLKAQSVGQNSKNFGVHCQTPECSNVKALRALNPHSEDETFFKNNYRPLKHNQFPDFLNKLISEIKKIPDLGSVTLYQAMIKIFPVDDVKSFLPLFPYWSECYTLRADMALQSFESEMGSDEFYYCNEGLSSLIKRLGDDCKERGLKIFMDTAVVGWKRNQDGYAIFTKDNVPYNAKKIVFALHANALHKIDAFKHWQILSQIRMEPLLRCYAIFPKNSKGIACTENIPKFATNTPLRFYIPMNPKEGIAMISYTDGADARHWLKILKEPAGEYKLRRKIVAEFRKHFPEVNIPDPLFFKIHPWYDGCSYWMPGSYDPLKSSRDALRPFGKKEAVFCCGESFSMKQAWMEGALEHANELGKIL